MAGHARTYAAFLNPNAIAKVLFFIAIASLAFNSFGGFKKTVFIEANEIEAGTGKYDYSVDWKSKSKLAYGLFSTLYDYGIHRGLYSSLRLYEDNILLGPPHSKLSEIIRTGRGQYRHDRGILCFSTSDGTDSRRNGRQYSAAQNFGVNGWLLSALFIAAIVLRMYVVIRVSTAVD